MVSGVQTTVGGGRDRLHDEARIRPQSPTSVRSANSVRNGAPASAPRRSVPRLRYFTADLQPLLGCEPETQQGQEALLKPLKLFVADCASAEAFLCLGSSGEPLSAAAAMVSPAAPLPPPWLAPPPCVFLHANLRRIRICLQFILRDQPDQGSPFHCAKWCKC